MLFRQARAAAIARSLSRQLLMVGTMMDVMSTNTMSFAFPEALRSYVDQRVRSGQYGNTSEYRRELIRRDEEEQAKKYDFPCTASTSFANPALVCRVFVGDSVAPD
jgi:putative addiction module CopG family antidote